MTTPVVPLRTAPCSFARSFVKDVLGLRLGAVPAFDSLDDALERAREIAGTHQRPTTDTHAVATSDTPR
jgi:hypothetical protein